MAQIFPKVLPDSATPGEKAMLAVLRKLGDDCVVFYEPGIANRRPDFIVVIPDLGLLVIEVKDWLPSTLREASAHYVKIVIQNRELQLTHPEEQARRYAILLKTKCEADRFAQTLLRPSGKYQGRLNFPIAWIAAYSNVSRTWLKDAGLSPCFEPARNITSDVLAGWRRLDDAGLRTELRTHFGVRWECALSADEVEILTSLIYPIRVAAPAGDDGGDELHVLDAKQRELACFPHRGHRVLRGVSGSGKTIILIARARLLAEQGHGRILFLCYNKLLCDFVAQQFTNLKNVEVRTFHAWCGKNGIDFRAYNSPDTVGTALRRQFECGAAPDAARFESVLIDEAQLMSCDWLACARMALKQSDPREASLLVAADGAQSLNKLIRFNWKDAGIAASGRTTILTDNYRNTKEIVSIAETMLIRRDDIGGPSDAARADPARCKRNGPLPELVPLTSRENECDYAASLVKLWLLAGRPIRGRTVKPRPEDIAIIYPHRASGAGDFTENLKSALAPVPLSVLSGEAPGRFTDPGVRLMSMKKAPGLQFRFVILLWTDLLPTRFADQDDDALLYMAMTRAEDVLVMVHSRASDMVARISAGLAANGAPELVSNRASAKTAGLSAPLARQCPAAKGQPAPQHGHRPL
jgi:hypothetical protein